MSQVDLLELFGYVASVIVAISLTMSSIVKLRWWNLLGASCFGTYGLMIGALPVALLNYFIALANIYYLFKMYTEKAHFRVLPISTSDVYLKEFISLHESEIKEFFPPFGLREDRDYISMMIHRDLAVAGMFIGHKIDNTTLEMDLDFVLAPYRDMKPGQFIFKEHTEFFKKHGVKKIVSAPGSEGHTAYLTRIGFVMKDNRLELDLV